MKYLILLITINVWAQNCPPSEVVNLNDLPSDWTLGNPCNVENYIDKEHYGDLVLKGNSYIRHAKLIVHGYIIYNGYTITLQCPDAELIETRQYLSEHDLTKEDITIYPNPVTNKFHINIKEEHSITIFDLNGKLVGSSNCVKNLSNGLYLVRISTPGRVQTIKLIKK